MPWETRSSTTTYDFVSHGGTTSGADQCYGIYSETTQTGWGPAYQYNCIHSGTISSSGDVSTVWYNYAIASAGTITNENTTQESPASNTNPATESICPKGWTLPNNTQIDSQRNVASFSPVMGGTYVTDTLYSEGARGWWWGSTASSGARRHNLGYDGSSLYTSSDGRRRNGLSVRCVVKKNTKTLSNLTYMQDMTPQTSFWTLVNGRSYDEV